MDESEQNKVIIVGTNEESRRVIEVLEKTGINIDYIGRIGEHEDDVLLGNYSDLRNIVEIFKPEEIIFCTKDVAIKKVILWMTELGNMIHYKILPEGGESLIGSNSKNTSGDLYARDINLKLGQAHSQRNKRVFDLFTALFLLIISPFMIIKNKNKCSITNLLLVIFGTLSFVGFFKNNEQNYLPHIKPGLLFPIINQNKIVNAATELQLNLRYAKNYSISEDIRIVYSYLFR